MSSAGRWGEQVRGAGDAGAADWVVSGMRSLDSTVGSIVPAVFDAYARVFHPASRRSNGEDVEVSWAEVAAANGREMHPAAEWGSLVGSWQLDAQADIWDREPRTGELPRRSAGRLAALLEKHTHSPDRVCFALWEGGDVLATRVAVRSGTPEKVRRRAQLVAEEQVAAWRTLVSSGAPFTLPGRQMRLLGGPLSAVGAFYELHHRPPCQWWPEDRAWCVGTDIDLMTTYVGGSSACIDDLLRDDRIESLAVSVDQLVTWDADTVNPRPSPPSW